jgi:hypothetical protein
MEALYWPEECKDLDPGLDARASGRFALVA